MTPQERYLKALEDPTSGITAETPAHLIEGTVQKSFCDAIKTSDGMLKRMSYSEIMEQARRNSEIGTRDYRLAQKRRA